jgi:RimJ/RimL family protein N-acetyltransferase
MPQFDLPVLSFTLGPAVDPLIPGARVAFTQLQTDRLFVRRFQDGDLRHFVDYRNDPEVARYQSWDSISEARAIIQGQKRLEPGVPGQWLQFVIELKETPVGGR